MHIILSTYKNIFGPAIRIMAIIGVGFIPWLNHMEKKARWPKAIKIEELISSRLWKTKPSSGWGL
jgi:hypothetical protein